MADEFGSCRVKLVEAFFHPRFGVVLWHCYVDFDGLPPFVMSANVNDEANARSFVEEYTEQISVDDKPIFSAN